MSSLISTANLVKENYWPLIKSRQTFLLTLTGVAGYLYQQAYPPDWMSFLGLIGSLLLSIGGCSVLNMLFDRDIDRVMLRTRLRPLANGRVRTTAAAFFGAVLITIGLTWAAMLSTLYFMIVLAGAVLNVVIYTLWLKRRTAWSVLWGGVAGSMPILAGRALAVGQIDTTALVLGLIIMCWIPSHNLTLTSLYTAEYIEARVPTFDRVYGSAITRGLIILSSLLTAFLTVTIFIWLNPSIYILLFMILTSTILVGLSIIAWVNRAENITRTLYKYSSVFMLFTMLLLALNGLF